MARVFTFLGLPQDGGLLQQVIEHNSLERMRYKEQTEPATKGENAGDSFVRKGETAGWKQELPVELRKRLEAEYRELLERLCYPLEAS